MLISVHLPKTAGSSFRNSLASHFGDSMLLDYLDRPTNQSPVVRNLSSLKASVVLRNKYRAHDLLCIHGHFMPLKYRWLSVHGKKNFVVWLRDPIERVASHYYYWIRDYDPKTAGSLRRRVVEERWSLERFCFSSEMKNIYSSFFWGFPVSSFDFIGITENYESDLNYFAANILGSELPVSEVNLNPRKTTDRYIEDEYLRSSLEKFHLKDMKLYWDALKVSDTRR